MNWELDSVGNWERRYGMPEDATEPLSDTYSHNGINALVQAGDWLYEYDRNGSRVSAQAPLTATQYAALTPTFGLSATVVITYGYNYENRLTTVNEAICYPHTVMSGTEILTTSLHVSPTMNAQYVYDGLGRRVEKWVTRVISAGGVLAAPEILHRFYVYDGLDVIAEYEELDGLLNSTTYYYRGNGRLVALEREVVSDTVALLWYHFDGLGSVVALGSQNGNVSTIYRYGEYGHLLGGDVFENYYAYTGQEWDKETKFYHFYARYYDSSVGIWLVQDSYRGEVSNPIALARYVYVSDNPITFHDLFGFLTSSKFVNDIDSALNSNRMNEIRLWNERRREHSRDHESAVAKINNIQNRASNRLIPILYPWESAQIAGYKLEMLDAKAHEVKAKLASDASFYILVGFFMPFDYKHSDLEFILLSYQDSAKDVCGVTLYEDDWGNFAFGILGNAAGYTLDELLAMSNWGDAIAEVVKEREIDSDTITDFFSGVVSWGDIGDYGDPKDRDFIKAGFEAYDFLQGNNDLSIDDYAPYFPR
jgi:RHS repeat-associated protein